MSPACHPTPAAAGPLVIAHRGAPGAGAPENTIAAFARARELGAGAVELDVRRTGDGQLVVFHDRDVAGVRLEAQTHEELCRRAGIDVPTLEQALDWARETGTPLDVELKEDGYLPQVRSRLAAETYIVTSFSEAILRGLADLRTGLLITLTARAAVERARGCGARALVVQAGLVDARLVEEVAAADLELLVWDFEPARHAPLLEADPAPAALITDDVQGTRRAVGTRFAT